VSCCTTTHCLDRIPLAGGGWACWAALEDGRLHDATPSTTPPATTTRRPGWSRGAVVACPSCGGRAYSPGPNGLPQRRCHAAECGHIWNPEERP
jgi:hypothetical protein